MVHLGNHPEVALCVRCARWAAKQAGEVEDRDRRSPLAAARNGLRRVRRGVVDRGWQQNRFVGVLLRRLGRLLP